MKKRLLNKHEKKKEKKKKKQQTYIHTYQERKQTIMKK